MMIAHSKLSAGQHTVCRDIKTAMFDRFEEAFDFAQCCLLEYQFAHVTPHNGVHWVVYGNR